MSLHAQRHGAAPRASTEPLSRRLAEVALALTALVIVAYYLSLANKYMTSAPGILGQPTLLLVGLLVSFALTLLFCFRYRLARLYDVVRAYWLIYACSGLLALAGLIWSLMPEAHSNLYFTLLYGFNFVILIGSTLLPSSRLFRHNWRYVLLVPFLMLVASVLYGAVVPETSAAGYVDRPAGLALNPNLAGFGIALLCAALLRPHRIDPFNVAVLCLSGVAIFVTLSRGGLIYLGALLFFYLWTVKITLDLKSVAVLGLSIVLGLVGIVYGAKPLLEGAKLNDTRFAMLTLERDPLADYSATERISLIVQTVERIKEAPILGHGTAATNRDPAGPHNMYLKLWAELGLVGLLSYVLFLAAGYRMFAQRRFFTGQAVNSCRRVGRSVQSQHARTTGGLRAVRYAHEHLIVRDAAVAEPGEGGWKPPSAQARGKSARAKFGLVTL